MHAQSEKLSSARTSSLISIILPLGFLAIFVISCLGGISYMSHTVDEELHLTRGIMLLKTGDYRLNRHHPPLANTLNAIPLLFMDGLQLPSTQSEEWKLSKKGKLSRMFAEANGGYRSFVKRILNRARLVTVALMAIGAIMLFLAVKRNWGLVAASVFLLLYILEPTMVAHSSLVTTDALLVPLIFGATYALYRYAKTHKKIHLCIFTIISFLSLLTKYSAVPVAVLWLALLFICVFKNTPADYPGMKRFFRALLVPAVIACLWAFLLTAAYGFRFETLAEVNNDDRGRMDIHMNIISNISGEHDIIASALQDAYQLLPLPFPEYILGFLGNVVVHDFIGHEAFLFGRYSRGGWWYYFPLAMLVKMPVPFLAGIAWLLFYAVFRMCRWGLRFNKARKIFPLSFNFPVEYILFAVPIFFFVLSLTSNVNIGLRHIIPVFPFMALAIGILVSKCWSKHVWVKIAVIIMGVWFLLSTLSIFPYHLEYFNELVGGPSNGYKYLLDSNLTWGQDRFLVQDYVDNLPTDTTVYINPQHEVKKGVVVINVNLLMGRFAEERPKTAWLRDKVLSGEIKPTDRIAYTHMVFDF